jgi:small subunit ribosomal protein S20
MRNSARKQSQNHSVKTRLHTLEKKYLDLLKGGKREEAAAALRTVSGAYAKAVKVGVVHAATANRKKSRLAVKLNVAK